MNKKLKIVIAGLGGVGGYFGGLLAKKYEGDANIEIIFLARGNHLEKIKTDGLKVIHGDQEFIARPHLATDNTSLVGTADLVLICTKSYDLESVINQLKPCIDQQTILVPLLNGVNSSDLIQHMVPDSITLQGCVYIVSKLKAAGVIENVGNIQKLFFGPDNDHSNRLNEFQTLFAEADIDTTVTNKISSILWEKFIFIAPTATATCYLDCVIGELLDDGEKQQILKQLIEEVKRLADARQIRVEDDIAMLTLNKLKALPHEATSSMYRDFKQHKAFTEIETLTGYVIHEGKKLNLPTPTFDMAYDNLTNKK